MLRMLSVIVPAYNEGKKIYSNLSQINDCLASFVEGDYEIVAVTAARITPAQRFLVRRQISQQLDQFYMTITKVREEQSSRVSRILVAT